MCKITPGCKWDNDKCEQKKIVKKSCNEFKELIECNKNSYCQFNVKRRGIGFCEPKDCSNFKEKEECNQTTYCTIKSYKNQDGSTGERCEKI
jgi:hypothetical protein